MTLSKIGMITIADTRYVKGSAIHALGIKSIGFISFSAIEHRKPSSTQVIAVTIIPNVKVGRNCCFLLVRIVQTQFRDADQRITVKTRKSEPKLLKVS